MEIEAPENFLEAIPIGAWWKRACGGGYCGIFRSGVCGRKIRRCSEMSSGYWARFFGSSPASNDGDGKVSFKKKERKSVGREFLYCIPLFILPSKNNEHNIIT